MQINRVGYFLLVLFGVGGAVFAIFPPTRLLGVIWVLTVVGLIAYALQQRRKAGHDKWLVTNGLRGRATIVEAGSHSTINDQPVMRFVLDLEVPGQAPHRVGHKTVVAVFAAHRMQPGLVLPVFVNPGDPSDFVLQW